MIRLLGRARCQAGAHALNRPFTWTAHGRRYARQVCTRSGCRHSTTYEVLWRPRGHRRPSRTGVVVPRPWTLALAVLAGILTPTLGDVIRLGIHP